MKLLFCLSLAYLFIRDVDTVDDDDIDFIKKLLLTLKHQIRDDKQKEESKGVPNIEGAGLTAKSASILKTTTPFPFNDVIAQSHVSLSTKSQSTSTQSPIALSTDVPATSTQNAKSFSSEGQTKSTKSVLSLSNEVQPKSDGIFFVQKHDRSHRPKRNRTVEWFSNSGRDFHGWRDELSFPGSDFILNMIDSYLTNGMFLERTIKDPFKADETIISQIGSDIENVTSVLSDPEVLALIYTRRVTSYIQQERMLCAAAKFDMMAIEAMMMEISDLFVDDDESMEDFLLALLIQLPTIPGLQWDIRSMAIELGLRIHDRIFNDTVHYLLGKSYIDVTMFAHTLFPVLKKFFSSKYVWPEVFVAVVTDILRYDANVHCPTDRELKMQRRDTMWDLNSQLEEVETTELCMGMRSFIEANFFSSGSPPSMMATSDDYEKTMQNMCDYVKVYVSHFYRNLKEYEVMLMQRDPDGIKQLFQKYLSSEGLLTLVSVLETLRWVPNFPIIDKVEPTNLNTSAEEHPVLEHARSDVSFWESFLDNLTPETFTQMDLLDFKQSIRRWLEHKYRIINEYTSRNLLRKRNH